MRIKNEDDDIVSFYFNNVYW